ncbi:hypothetical protein KZZ52_36390 [Dactylosporangium sp. AC04546]|uniref:hypothetical protein n=1 Tax=Dactylosporangium sp. AC04546 TaxID=2862460 RepID=UPI001EDFDC84|nr:hypothetical protein [Dactylosporangium sp. AC04546]WVK79445.1 hypothetical protein KZZ52_36390 [Dactylosporangium sp. AC04546]
MTRRPVAVLAALTMLFVLAGCSSGQGGPGGPGGPGASPSGGLDEERALSIGRRFAQCARDHGYPSFPDPEIRDGDLAWPAAGLELKEQIRTIMEQQPECKAIMDESMSLSDNRRDPTPSAEDLQKLRAFAKCMREQGVDGFPDPLPDGTFPLVGTPLEHEGKSERVLTAIDACKHLYDKKIAIS